MDSIAADQSPLLRLYCAMSGASIMKLDKAKGLLDRDLGKCTIGVKDVEDVSFRYFVRGQVPCSTREMSVLIVGVKRSYGSGLN